MKRIKSINEFHIPEGNTDLFLIEEFVGDGHVPVGVFDSIESFVEAFSKFIEEKDTDGHDKYIDYTLERSGTELKMNFNFGEIEFSILKIKLNSVFNG